MAARRLVRSVAILGLAAMLASDCASLGGLAAFVRPPTFQESPDHQAEIRLLSPGRDTPLGAAGVRLWTRVGNPNPFGLTLGTLRGTLFLGESRAATVDFPLGLPLTAGGDATVPIDLTIQFSDVPQLAQVIRRAIDSQPIDYRLDGTIGVETRSFGTPVFGPMTILRGVAR
jgi:hypothetical protein